MCPVPNFDRMVIFDVPNKAQGRGVDQPVMHVIKVGNGRQREHGVRAAGVNHRGEVRLPSVMTTHLPELAPWVEPGTS